jgi:hypothetical protein
VSDAVSSRSRPSIRSSARLGLILRAVILMPGEGFDAAAKAAERRARAGQRPAEGVTPYVLAAVGGAALFLLWLKLGGLASLREAPKSDFRAVYLAMVVFLGGLLGLAGQFAWGWMGPPLLGTSGEAAGRTMRIVWGLAALPQVVVMSILLPLDLAVVGPHSFTTGRLPDPVSTTWAAASIAISTAAAAWSVWLFFTGLHTLSGSGRWRALRGLVTGVLLVVALFAPLVVAGRLS